MIRKVLPSLKNINCFIDKSQVKHIATTCSALAGGRYRRNLGLPKDRLSFGPMTDIPDWTYVDQSKPPVVSVKQRRRQMKRVEIGATISRLLKEIDEQKSKS